MINRFNDRLDNRERQESFSDHLLRHMVRREGDEEEDCLMIYSTRNIIICFFVQSLLLKERHQEKQPKRLQLLITNSNKKLMDVKTVVKTV